MKIMKYISLAMALSLLVFLPPALYGQEGAGGGAAQGAAPPAIAPPLIPEGQYAVELAKALNLGQAQSEAEAENLLSAAGIEPKNGWIGDYPVTPDVLAEIHEAVAAAADAGKLTLDRDTAVKAADETTARLGLAGGPAPAYAGETPYAQAPPGSYSADPYASYPGPEPPTTQVVNNYYYTYGPPVVTYYPPPEAYGYLYAWVPYPFWYSSVYFSGFFILHDFHRTVTFHHRPFVISNHFVHPRTRTVVVVDPATRSRFGKGTFPRASSPRHFQTPSAQAGARSIVRRNPQGAHTVSPPATPGNRNTWGRGVSSRNWGAQQRVRPVQPASPRFSGGSNVNGRTNPNPPSPGPTVTTVRPIQPSVGQRQSAAPQTAPSARQATPSGQGLSSGRVPPPSAGAGNWAGRAPVRQPGSEAGGFTARRGGGFPGSAPGSRFSGSPSVSRSSQGSTSFSGRATGLFGGQGGAGGGMGTRGGFTRMR